MHGKQRCSLLTAVQTLSLKFRASGRGWETPWALPRLALEDSSIVIQCDVKSNNTRRNSIYRSVDDIARREHYKPSEMLQRFVNYSGLPERRFRFILSMELTRSRTYRQLKSVRCKRQGQPGLSRQLDMQTEQNHLLAYRTTALLDQLLHDAAA